MIEYLIDDKPVQASKSLMVRQFIARSERKLEMAHNYRFWVKKRASQGGTESTW
jgi:hypothetical protein